MVQDTGIEPPTWARWAAWGTVAAVAPSAVWRVLVGIGVDLGWSDEQLAFQHIPGGGTVYVIGLSVASLSCAALTFALVSPWGERFPRWFGSVAGRQVPPALPAITATVGAVAVLLIVAMSARNWDRVSGFADRPDSGWARLMAACYAPAALWPVLLLAVTADYWRRHRRLSAHG
ncbi:hypothetical protein ACFYT3_21800 [Nocardia amikacinitolerans]|uniref:hypothetical protein n=1 Tax=Nocardia amikacinitolerans TaxID=756689 RepID=UPI0036AD04ED